MAASSLPAVASMAIGVPGTTINGLHAITLNKLHCMVLEECFAVVVELTIYFIGDVNDPKTIGYDPTLTAAGVFSMLLGAAPTLKRVDIHGFQSYYVSRLYRQWKASAELFTALNRFPSAEMGQVVPCVERLTLRNSTFSNEDLDAICPGLPNLKFAEFACCAGYTESAFTDAIVPYVAYTMDNDDYWHPGDGENGLKNAGAYFSTTEP
jgi:hypothetical protein